MSRRKVVANDINEVEKEMKATKNKSEFQRLQAVYLGDTRPDFTAKQIGEIVRLSEHRVKMIHGNFRKNGMDAITDKRGGRYRENLTIAEETELLKQFEEQSENGKLIVAGKIKTAYEEKFGKEVAESTIYRMLDRHGFRKIVPYKRHPKGNKEEQETFKKTSKI